MLAIAHSVVDLLADSGLFELIAGGTDEIVTLVCTDKVSNLETIY